VAQQIAIIPDRLELLPGLMLGKGSHTSIEDGACVMEAAAWIAGERWSDHPQCACPVITAFLQGWNDSLSDEDRNRLLKPLILRVVGTRATPEIEKRRAIMAADWYIRVQTPAWLRLAGLTLAGLTEQADAVAALPEIADFLECPSLMPVLTAVRGQASAAESAAWSAARSAAESAAWSAARSAAWSAARSAAESAARSAAESAAWSALETTRLELQASALDLVIRMIDLSATPEAA
jgi:signal transduction histidine kinase